MIYHFVTLRKDSYLPIDETLLSSINTTLIVAVAHDKELFVDDMNLSFKCQKILQMASKLINFIMNEISF